MARRNPPSFDFYPDDFMGGTYYMAPLALGMYVRFICYQWNNDLLPNDPLTLAKIACVTPAEFDEHWPELRVKFVSDQNGGMYNERLKSEKDRKLLIKEQRAEAGQKGGQAKAKQMLSKRGSKNVAKGSRKMEDGSGKVEGEKGSGDSVEPFDVFWSTVTRRVKKADARKAFDRALVIVATERKIHRKAAAEWIIERMTAFAASDVAKGEYCPYPSTWLNGGRYDDDPAQWEERANGKPKESTRI